MNTEESQVLEHLKTFPEVFFSPREIAREVGGKKRYREEPDWAKPILKRLLNRDLVETDSMNRYRLKPEEEKRKPKFHVAPHIAEILRKSGKAFAGLELDDPVQNTDDEAEPPPEPSP